MMDARAVVDALVSWFNEHARTLPWRSDPTPYHVLLSELMLQQTRVETVIPYFERFTARWPTLGDLAKAKEEEVLHAWAGLGYYSRARNLLRCAVAVSERGEMPQTVDGLRELPGVGPYTAGAIASIAFGVRAPLVDGNVERVVSRLDARAEDPRGAGKKALWARVTDLHEAAPEEIAPGDLNQALMELGATVCKPKQPRCDVCVLSSGCLAHAANEVAAYPKKKPKKPPTPMFSVAGIWRRPDGVVLGRRPNKGLLSGLYEPIGMEIGPEDDPAEALVKAFRERIGVTVKRAHRVGEVVHVFSHRRLRAAVFWIEEAEGSPECREGYSEVTVRQDPEDVALSTLARRILALQPQLELPLAADGTYGDPKA
ncbi:MAG: A/G-specific adenine glycosylase [Myxococcota bacterium]